MFCDKVGSCTVVYSESIKKEEFLMPQQLGKKLQQTDFQPLGKKLTHQVAFDLAKKRTSKKKFFPSETLEASSSSEQKA